MKDIFWFIILSIYKSCDWMYFFHKMVIEIVFNKKSFFSNQFIFLRGKYIFFVHYWMKFKLKLLSYHLDKILIRYQSSKIDVFLQCFKWSRLIECTLFLYHKWGGLVDFSSLGFKDQTSQMTWVMVNNGMLTKYTQPL